MSRFACLQRVRKSLQAASTRFRKGNCRRDVERYLERVVEYRVARAVGKISWNDGVVLAEPLPVATKFRMVFWTFAMSSA